MARYGIVIDTDECMACYNCFVACKDEHCGFDTSVSASQPHEGQAWIRIDEKERGDDKRLIKTLTVATPCLHCTEPACGAAANGGAVYKRDDGIVIIDPVKSKGQKAIMETCPIGAVYWNEDLDIPQKCTMCAHLLDEGFEMPRCVEACPNGALHFGNLDDPGSEVSLMLSKGKFTPLAGMEGKETAVLHLNIHSVFAGGSVYLPDDEAADGACVRLEDTASGEVRETLTNYFGDYFFEDLTKGALYKLSITYPGYKEEALDILADDDHFIGETILEVI